MKNVLQWIKRNKLKLTVPLCIAAVLLAAFFYGGNSPSQSGDTAKSSSFTESLISTDSSVSAKSESDGNSDKTESDGFDSLSDNESDSAVSPSKGSSAVGSLTAEKDKYQTDPVPEGKPEPVEPEDAAVTAKTYHCTISISCASILNNMSLCNPEKVELIPSDGWILKPTKVAFKEGESVFDVLRHVCTEKKIHLEFSWTPIYNSAYIEGINNLYELDAGDLSGWMYKVNGWFPNYGCSRYQLKDGDTVCLVYTCDCGNDVGGGYAVN